MFKKIVLLIVISCFLGSCAREASHHYVFGNSDSVKIDESNIVMTRFPFGLRAINDSTIGLVNNDRNISLFNIVSGKNTLNFSTETIDFDSLIQNTFQKRYEGKRIYHYDEKSAGGLSGGNSQVLGFDHSGNKYYIYVNCLTDVNYDNDPVQLKKYKDDPQLKAVREKTGDFNLIVGEYLQFIFITDQQFHIEKIVPLYEQPQLSRDQYTPYYQKGITVADNSLYFPIQKDGQTFINIQGKINCNPGVYALAKFNLSNPGDIDYLLDYKNIDFKGFSLHQYLSSAMLFSETSNGLLFSNGKEICSVESGEKMFSRASLKENEWIYNYHYCDNGNLVLATYMVYKKANPTEMDIAYGIDSIGTLATKIIDTKHGVWLGEKQLSSENRLASVITDNKIIFVDKGKENYFLKILPYHEN